MNTSILSEISNTGKKVNMSEWAYDQLSLTMRLSDFTFKFCSLIPIKNDFDRKWIPEI